MVAGAGALGTGGVEGALDELRLFLGVANPSAKFLREAVASDALCAGLRSRLFLIDGFGDVVKSIVWCGSCAKRIHAKRPRKVRSQHTIIFRSILHGRVTRQSV